MTRFYIYANNATTPTMTLHATSISEWGGLWALYDSNHKLITIINKKSADVQKINSKEYAVYFKEEDYEVH